MSEAVNDTNGVIVIRPEAILRGEVRKCRHMHVYGYVEGKLDVGDLTVHEGGRCYGTIRADSAKVEGTLQGDAFVKHLMSILATGSVTGNVQYGQLAMEHGGTLSAELRNVPPSVAGDLQLEVTRGQWVALTTRDLTALDPDDVASDLVYSVTAPEHGSVILAGGNGTAISQFTQADLEAGRVIFVHDGGSATDASFDVVVRDKAGATSGAAKRVNVAVSG